VAYNGENPGKYEIPPLLGIAPKVVDVTFPAMKDKADKANSLVCYAYFIEQRRQKTDRLVKALERDVVVLSDKDKLRAADEAFIFAAQQCKKNGYHFGGDIFKEDFIMSYQDGAQSIDVLAEFNNDVALAVRTWRQEGRQEGLQEGRQEGLQEGLQERAELLREVERLRHELAKSARVAQPEKAAPAPERRQKPRAADVFAKAELAADKHNSQNSNKQEKQPPKKDHGGR
jgi:hypothetical protein